MRIVKERVRTTAHALLLFAEATVFDALVQYRDDAIGYYFNRNPCGQTTLHELDNRGLHR